ncbi:MAG: hypothetical protein ACLQU9_02275 [Acidimicrobiales bacterium]
MPKHTGKGAAPSEANGSRSPGSTPGKGPESVAHSSRVNVAFPFSQIKLQEPSQELADLAGVVFDLVVAMAEWLPDDDRLDELRARAEALRERLR